VQAEDVRHAPRLDHSTARHALDLVGVMLVGGVTVFSSSETRAAGGAAASRPGSGAHPAIRSLDRSRVCAAPTCSPTLPGSGRPGWAELSPQRRCLTCSRDGSASSCMLRLAHAVAPRSRQCSSIHERRRRASAAAPGRYRATGSVARLRGAARRAFISLSLGVMKRGCAPRALLSQDHRGYAGLHCRRQRRYPGVFGDGLDHACYDQLAPSPRSRE
jgi:hypothetical protein